MSTLSVIGLVALLLVIAIGTGLKLATRQKLKDIDGLDSALVVTEGERDANFVNTQLKG